MRILTATAVAAMLGLGALTAAPTVSQAQMDFGSGASVGFPPPPLPIYDQPAIPDYGYIWTPGYWAWDANYGDYYWVPGTWVLPPEDGLLWTPAWWGWTNGFYVFHDGYWGPQIGYYGGIDYGFGYTGYGYQGGYWRGREFFYNRAVNNVRNVRITNVFERPVMGAPRRNRVSFTGGVGGVVARPTPEQMTAMRERRFAPTVDQTRHVRTADADRRLSARVNHGAPPITATPRPAVFAPPHAPPANHPQGGPPARTGYPGYHPGYRPVAPPPNYPAARSNSPGYGGPAPIRPPNYPAPHSNAPEFGAPPPTRPSNNPVAGPPPYHPPSSGPSRPAPPPRQAPPPQPVRPPQPPQHSEPPKNQPH